ncbi:MAG: PKD domain-containing protein [Nanoarchaeota archaeon]|nr:PKD domain-containing protein [Nanoarchaeota archaeon]
MKKRGVIYLFFLFGLIISLTLISASFESGIPAYSLEKYYAPQENLRGWINLSLNNEPTNSLFKDSLGNSITLLNLLNKNTGFVHSCTVADCSSDYSSINPTTTKSFELNPGESKILGFKLEGEVVSINSVTFNIQSNAATSCYNQLKIDVLNDGSFDIGNTKSTTSSCSFLKNYGCYNEGNTLYETTISEVPFCQKIRFYESPGFNIGAWVKEQVSGSKKITMSLYNLLGEDLEKSCELQKDKISSEGGEVSCSIDYLVLESAEYYVCISSNSGGGEYRIKGYSFATNESNNCGFRGYPVKDATNAYKIFSESKRFDEIGTIKVENSLISGENFGEMIKNYLDDKYGFGVNCPSEGCIIPVRFKSREYQNIVLSNLSIVYEKTGLPGIIEKKLYDLEEIPSKVNANFQKLYLNEGGFSLPSNYGNISFNLSLNNKGLLLEEIIIEKVPIIKDLTPLSTASAYPTEFTVKIDAYNNITSYKWNFGDNKTLTTTTNKVTHTYESTGIYELLVTVSDSEGLNSSKAFNVYVESPEEIINKTLAEMQKNLENVKKEIENFTVFYQESINTVLDTEEINEELKQIQRDFLAAYTEEDYNLIMKKLLEIKIPESITITTIANSISFYPEEENINLNILQTIGSGEYDSGKGDKYTEAVLLWNSENMETKLTYKEIALKYEESEEPALYVFELEIKEEENLNYDSYLILRKLEGLIFKENYLESEESGYVYIDLTKEKNSIAFSTTEEVNFMNLPLFISPEIRRLSLREDSEDGGDNKNGFSNWIFVIIILIVFFGLVLYIIMQEWYKRKYETHLFKNRNYLYNLINYIENAKKRGMTNQEIEEKLKKSGWTSEQIRYAMRKHAGKRTGMFEIPIDKVLNKFKRKKTDVPKKQVPFQPKTYRPQRFSGANKRPTGVR